MERIQRFRNARECVDLAIGVIIGVAFGKIVTSFVEDVLMPPIGLALGGVDFSNLFINLSVELILLLRRRKRPARQR